MAEIPIPMRRFAPSRLLEDKTVFAVGWVERILDSDQVPEHLIEPFQDAVDELRMTAEQLVSFRSTMDVERKHYRELFEAAPCAYLISDLEGTIDEANLAAGELLGYDPPALQGQTLAEFVAEADRREVRNRIRGLGRGSPIEWEFEIVTLGGEKNRVSCIASRRQTNGKASERIYWILREKGAADGDAGSWTGSGSPPAVGVAVEVTDRPKFNELLPHAHVAPDAPVPRQLHEIIAGALDSGALRPGQRLPSIRAIAERFGITPYSALQAYASLEAEGVVERRERSGVYVAPLDWPAPPRLPETAEWLANVLTEACEHHLRIPNLPDLVRSWTGSVQLRAVCVESCLDSRASLARELKYRFGIESIAAEPDQLSAPTRLAHRAVPPEILSTADIIITTPFHASGLRGIAAAARKPLLVATLNPDIVEAIDAHVAHRPLTVVCLDRRFGERLCALHGGIYRDAIRVVLASEFEDGDLDPTEPVFITQPARDELSGMAIRLIVPPSPCFSLEFASKVTAMLLRLNLDAHRT